MKDDRTAKYLKITKMYKIHYIKITLQMENVMVFRFSNQFKEKFAE